MLADRQSAELWLWPIWLVQDQALPGRYRRDVVLGDAGVAPRHLGLEYEDVVGGGVLRRALRVPHKLPSVELVTLSLW